MSKRKEQRDAYKALRAKFEEILFRHDPIGINFETNADEYEPEVRTILPRMKICHSVEDVLVVVLEEFHHWFGDDIREEKEDYKLIANDLWRCWSEFSGP